MGSRSIVIAAAATGVLACAALSASGRDKDYQRYVSWKCDGLGLAKVIDPGTISEETCVTSGPFLIGVPCARCQVVGEFEQGKDGRSVPLGTGRYEDTESCGLLLMGTCGSVAGKKQCINMQPVQGPGGNWIGCSAVPTTKHQSIP